MYLFMMHSFHDVEDEMMCAKTRFLVDSRCSTCTDCNGEEICLYKSVGRQ